VADPVRVVHMTHLNAIVDGFDDTVELFQRRFGAQFNMDIPGSEVHACLVNVGRVIFELFAPHERAERGQGRLLARYGDHYIGIEYQVPDLDQARAAVADHKMRILNDPGVYFLTHPADSFGVSFEIYDGDWHAEPPPAPYVEAIKPAAYWRDEHGLGCAGLKRYSIAVRDLTPAVTFFREAFGAEVLYEASRLGAAARAVGLGLADTVAELISPVGPGPVADYLERYGERIRATVLAVRDLGQAQRYFADQGLDLGPGDAPDTLALSEHDSHGLRFEFSE
jgi:Glyoxalase/Bleomycin resistance protein/Dioxygenase superfamily